MGWRNHYRRFNKRVASMNNEIKSITLNFGERVECHSECGMRKRYPISCGQHSCEHLKASVTFDLQETCPDCGGTGELIEGYCLSCNRCHGSGEIPKYWTPEKAARKIKEETGIDWEWGESAPMWYVAGDQWNLGTKRYTDPTKANFPIRVLSFPGQPAPPNDYRPEETK